MSPSTKVRISSFQGTRIGQTTCDEHKRTKPTGSAAKSIRKANELNRSGNDPGLERRPNQVLAGSLSSEGSGGLDLQKS